MLSSSTLVQQLTSDPLDSFSAMSHSKKQASQIHQSLDVTGPLSPLYGDRPAVDADNVELQKLLNDGYVVLHNVISRKECEEIREEVHQISESESTQTGRNNFEGRKTLRPYGILGKSRKFDSLLIHKRITDLLDQTLSPNYLITASQAIILLPGETPQPYHFDDAPCLIPRPRQHFTMGVIWAIDDFRSDNGATVIFPKSHRLGAELPSGSPIPCVMEAGSAVIFLGTLWHGGGANTSSANRMCVTFQYCEPFIRPAENQFLSVPPQIARTLSPQIQSMMGYSIHPPFVGHSNGRHPLKALSKL